MNYSKEEVLQFVREEDVKFIRLAFCDVFGKPKNISIMPGELERAFEDGISFDGSAIAGFTDEACSDLFLHPEPESLMPLPWRPEHGQVVQMFSSITDPNGRPFLKDTRYLLKKSVRRAREAGYDFSFGAEQEFYLFLLDENSKPTRIPCDEAGYMDIAPEDHGENVRREICLTLEKMGLHPERSHHEEGPGQNEIDFRYSDPLTAADQAITFQRVVKTIAFRNGLEADFSPKPLPGQPGSGFHINLSVQPHSEEAFSGMVGGILEHILDMTAFLNPVKESYLRLGDHKAPQYISWSHGNRSQLIRIPAAKGQYRRMELRSADPLANPYLAFALMIDAALEGIQNHLSPKAGEDRNLYLTDLDAVSSLKKLPDSLGKARHLAAESAFIREHIPAELLEAYLKH